MNNEIGAVILAAGRGKRMNTTDKNKVVFRLGNKPMILYAVQLLENLSFETIIVVVGFAKDSVKEALKNSTVIFAEQKEQLGTGHALKMGLKKLPVAIKNILVIYGDDSALYKKDIITSLVEKHMSTGAKITFLTLHMQNPTGLGRVVRDNNGNVVEIVEEKDATKQQKKITEINPACYVFNVEFLKTYLRQVEKSVITGEYYLTSLIDLAIQHNETIETVQGGNIAWRGVNTPEELQEAERLFSSRT